MAEIEMSGGGCTIRVSGLPDATDSPADWTAWIQSAGRNWMDMHKLVHEARMAELKVGLEQAKVEKAPRFEGGSAGFVIEQANEWRNDRLPAGGAA